MANSSSLEVLIGKTVLSATLASDTLILLFSDNTVLSVYNKFDLEDCILDDLSNGEIFSITEHNKKIVLALKHSGKLVIFMDDSAYSAPEAMQLKIPNKPIIVWN